jgi:squalene-hopene/tetraprenyl-beta-curcumene cyclase
MTTKRRSFVAIAGALTFSMPALAQPDAERLATARDMAAKAIDYLRAQQHESGGWSVRDEGPQLPAITGLAVIAFADNRDLLDTPLAEDPAVAKAVEFILSYRRPDGGIYDRILPSYNTAICLSALAKVAAPESVDSILPAQQYLRKLQYSEVADPDAGLDTVQIVGPEHPFYGGVGYGSHGRPDGSNLNLTLQALRDSGVPADDPAFKRALVFLERIQMHGDINDMPYADGSSQGGFIYATGPESDAPDIGESKAGTIEETMDDGTNVSRLRAYGSMTYAGFKSYAYADLDPDDIRVKAALDWIRRNYTLEENPGTGMQGLYYYFMTFSRALATRGEPTLDVYGLWSEGAAPTDELEARNWANDLIDRLEELQQEDGSFRSVHARWMEDNPVLITSYALIALGNARADN